MFNAEMMSAWRPLDGHWEMVLPTGWMQGRAVFGGLTAAACAALGRRVVSVDRPLRTAGFQMLRPTVPGSVKGQVEVLREGGHTTFLEVRLQQDSHVTLVAQLTFMKPRSGDVSVDSRRRWQGPDPEDLEDIPDAPGILPEFLQHLSLRWAEGGIPFSGTESARIRAYARFKAPSGGVEAVLGLLDAFPCPTLALYTTPTHASTVQWTAHLFCAPEELSGWCAFEYETIAAKDGCHAVAGTLHDEQGQLLGWTEQAVAVFSPR